MADPLPMITSEDLSRDPRFDVPSPGRIGTTPLDSLLSNEEAMAPVKTMAKKIYRTVARPHVSFAPTKEPVAYDDRLSLTYMPILRGQIWGGVYDCAWFHVRGKVPASFLSDHLVLHINIGGEGLVYEDGLPVQGISNTRCLVNGLSAAGGKTIIELNRTINGVTLLDPQGSFDFYMDAGYNGVSCIQNIRKAVFRYARICTVDDALRDFYYDYVTVLCLWWNYKEKLEAGQGKSGADDPVKKEEKLLRGLLDESFRLEENGEIHQASQVLQPVLSSDKLPDYKLTAVGHSHLDLAWMWPIRETKRKAARTFANQMANLDRYPDYIYGASQPWQYQELKDRYPDFYRRIKDWVEQGRIEPQGALWVEPDTNLPSGESLIRQIHYGKEFYRKEFGKEVTNCWLPDVFGYNGNLPQILAKSDVPYFMTIKLSWNEHNRFPFRTFNWYGIDKSRVLVNMPPDESYNSNGTPISTLHAMDNDPDKSEAKGALYLVGEGDGGGGCSDVHLEMVKREKSLRKTPPVEFGRAEDFFERLSKVRDSLPNYQGELYLEKHQGTYTTQARNKRYNRKIEYALQDLETLATYAWLMGAEYPQEQLDQWWKEVLLYQFHDILPGSGIGRVYKESCERYQIMLDQIRQMQEKLAEEILGKGTKNIAFNPTAFLLDSSKRGVRVFAAPFAFAEAEKIGSQDPSLTVKEERAGARGSFVTMSNQLLTLTFAPDGQILSFKDDKGHEYVKQYFNRLALYPDPKSHYNAWDIDWKYFEKRPVILKAQSTDVICKRSSLIFRAVYLHGRTRIVQDTILTAGSDVVDIKTKAEWHEKLHMLRAEFTPTIDFDKVSCDIQLGTLTRSGRDRTKVEKAQFEICAHKYIDVCDGEYGFSLLNDCKYGHRAKDGFVSLNLLRSPVFPDDTADLGEQQFTYSIYVHEGGLSVETLKRAYQLNKPAYFFRGGHLPQPLLSSTNRDVVIDTIKKAYPPTSLDGQGLTDPDAVVVRLYESQGHSNQTSLKIGFAHGKVYETNLQEEHPVETDPERLSFKPFEIKTIVIER